jgi:ferredoxin-thioredoxin reductase catalytic subunit
MLEELQGISPQDIAGFLASAGVGATGQNLLQKYLAQVFELLSQSMPLTGRQLAQTLLSSTSNRVAQAVVRSDIYQNWRAAQSKLSSTAESVLIAKCIPDDSYHVVNACYCDVFVTEDRDGQAIAAQYVAPETQGFGMPRPQRTFP